MIRQVSGSAKFPISFLDNTSIILSWVKTNGVHTNFAGTHINWVCHSHSAVPLWCHLLGMCDLYKVLSMNKAWPLTGHTMDHDIALRIKLWVKITIFITTENVTAQNTVLCTKYKINSFVLWLFGHKFNQCCKQCNATATTGKVALTCVVQGPGGKQGEDLQEDMRY